MNSSATERPVTKNGTQNGSSRDPVLAAIWSNMDMVEGGLKAVVGQQGLLDCHSLVGGGNANLWENDEFLNDIHQIMVDCYFSQEKA